MNTIKNLLNDTITNIKEKGLYKDERIIYSQQKAEIEIKNRKKVLNFCANNYLGLSNHPDLINASIKGLKEFGFGLSSVRFICGTQSIHRELEKKNITIFK